MNTKIIYRYSKQQKTGTTITALGTGTGGNGTGYNTKRHADAIAIGIWPSRGYEIIGYEIKRSRGDVRKELNEPEKADAVGKYCDFWYLVVEDLKIIDGLVIPPNWGILVPSRNVLRVHRKAPRLKSTPITRAFNAAIIRRVFSEYVPRWQLKTLEKKTYEDAKARAENEMKYRVEDSIHEYEDLKKRIEAFEKWSGIQLDDLSSYSTQQIGEAVKVIVEARVVAGPQGNWNAPEALVAQEIVRLERSIKNHELARDQLVSSRDRLEILRQSIGNVQQSIPELPE